LEVEMLERLVASDRPPGMLRRTPGAALSATVHGLLIAGAVVVTRPAPPPPPATVGDTIPWVLPPTDEPSDQSGPGVGDVPVIEGRGLDGLGDLIIGVPVDVPVGIPAPDAGPAFRRGAPDGARTSPWPWATTPGAGASAVMHATVADEAPLLLTSPAPVYPATLREAGRQGTVLIEIVVDQEGRPEVETLRVLTSNHPLFEAAARRVVLGARYRPGRWRGRPVRVLIRQPVEFRLR
jgi:protein TonB